MAQTLPPVTLWCDDCVANTPHRYVLSNIRWLCERCLERAPKVIESGY